MAAPARMWWCCARPRACWTRWQSQRCGSGPDGRLAGGVYTTAAAGGCGGTQPAQFGAPLPFSQSGARAAIAAAGCCTLEPLPRRLPPAGGAQRRQPAVVCGAAAGGGARRRGLPLLQAARGAGAGGARDPGGGGAVHSCVAPRASQDQAERAAACGVPGQRAAGQPLPRGEAEHRGGRPAGAAAAHPGGG